MDLVCLNEQGEPAGASVAVDDAAFGAAFNETLVHQVVTAYLAGARAGTRAQKTRAQVRGGGSKPWRQKGTGRARAGSSRSPLWRGGGVTFARQPSNHAQKLNRKMYRAGMRAIVSELVRQDRLRVVPEFNAASPKTRDMAARLKQMGLDDVLIVTDEVGRDLELSVRNLHWVDVQGAARVDPVSLMAFDKVLVTAAALKVLEGRLQ